MSLLRAVLLFVVLLLTPVLSTAQTVTIRAGQSATDRLTTADRTLGDGSYFHQYRFAGSVGEEIVINLRSADFDAYVMWGRLVDGVFEMESSDDDSGGGTDSELRVTQGAGDYAIRVNSFGSAETGAYTLTVESAGGGGIEVLGNAADAFWFIGPGETVTGRLGPDDSLFDGDRYYETFDYIGDAGEEVIITLRSSDFDAYLYWLEFVDDEYTTLDSNDDGGGGTDSQIRTTVGSGLYSIEVGTFGSGLQGAYTLTVERVGGGSTSGGGGAGGSSIGLQPITAGQTISESLQASDPLLSDGSHYRLYEYRGQPGEEIVLTLRSSAFDAFLAGGSWNGTELVGGETDDDSAGGTDARLTVRLGGDGVYAIMVNSYGEGETGAFTLNLQRSGTSSGAVGDARRIGPGETVSGRLATTDTQLQDESYYHPYAFEGRAGDRILVTLTSSDFDAYLVWGRRLPNGEFERLETNDDGGGGTNAQLDLTLPETRSYEIWANSYGASETGSYTLSVEGVGGASGVPLVALGQPVSAQLAASDPVLGDNSHYRIYAYRGTPGEQVLVTMRSTDFDAFLSGGRIVGDRFEPEESDDDSGGGRDAQLVATVGPSGSYAIRANSFTAGETGRFTLTVEPVGGARVQLPALPAGQPAIAAGARISGALRAGDPMLGDSSFYNQYVYQGRPGDRIRITLTSSDFDAYLRWGRIEGDRIQTEVYDDDSGGGTNAQLEVTVGGSGVYAVQANSYSAGQTGAYTLAVEPLGAAAPVAVETTSPSGLQGKWIPAYLDSSNPEYRSLNQLVKQWRPLEDLTNELNSRHPLPQNVQVTVDQCDFINAYYSPADSRIVFCYELIDYLADIFAPSGNWTVAEQDAVHGALRFILWHEIGHALVDQLDLPITGREEDAVDQLAAIMLMQSGEKGAESALRGVQALQPASDQQFGTSDYAGEHSLGPVRLYNILCWIYGSNPQRYNGLISSGSLPEDRAVRCPGEWDQMQKSWQRILAPHTQT